MFVDRDGEGNIVTAYGSPQRPGHEEIDDDDPDLENVLRPNPVIAEAAALIAAGIAIVSTGNPALNGTYPMTAEAERRINGLSLGPDLPKGAQTVPYPDVTGTPHAFTKPEIDALWSAMRDFAYDIEQTMNLKLAEQEAEWPTLPVTIA